MFVLSLFLLSTSSSNLVIATESDMYGSWKCGTSYETETGLFFETEYLVNHPKNSSLIYQEGFIRLTSPEDSNQISELAFKFNVSFKVTDENWIFTPISGTAEIVKNSLGLLSAEFAEDFENNKEPTKAIIALNEENEVTSTYENGDIIRCQRQGL